MKREHLTRTRFRVAPVDEARDNAGALIDERQRLLVIYLFEGGGSISAGLFLYRGELVPPLARLGLNDSDGPLVDEKRIVGRTDLSLVLADRIPWPALKLIAFLS